MSEIRSYRDLKVWQKAHSNVLKTVTLIESISRQVIFFPLCYQLLNSISSVSANIAEGYGSFRGKEYIRFLGIALRSAYESDNWLKVFEDLADSGCRIDLRIVEEIQNTNLEVIKMLTRLIKRLQSKGKTLCEA